MSEPLESALIQIHYLGDKVIIARCGGIVGTPAYGEGISMSQQDAVIIARQLLARDYRMRHMPAIRILEDYDAYDKLISRFDNGCGDHYWAACTETIAFFANFKYKQATDYAEVFKSFSLESLHQAYDNASTVDWYKANAIYAELRRRAAICGRLCGVYVPHISENIPRYDALLQRARFAMLHQPTHLATIELSTLPEYSKTMQFFVNMRLDQINDEVCGRCGQPSGDDYYPVYRPESNTWSGDDLGYNQTCGVE